MRNLNNQPPPGYQPPSISDPIFSPPVHTPDPRHVSSVVSPVNPGPPDSKAASLLSLLKGGNSNNNIAPSPGPGPLNAMRNVSDSASTRSASGLRNAHGQSLNGSATGDSKDFLLSLLNGSTKSTATQATTSATPPMPMQAPQPSTAATRQAAADLATAVETSSSSPMRVFGATEPAVTNFESPKQVQHPKFNYVNPFEALAPASQTPKASLAGKGAAAPALQAEDGPGLSVAQTLTNVGDQVDKEVEKALAQATHPNPITEPASTKRQKTDELADSWENVDTSPEVKIFSFPMRPFISIDLKNAKSPSSLRPESVMDIARLKKDFDQADRNLVSASDSHIVYAMQKTGGLRVIRQDSGRDKQIFRASQEKITHVQIVTDKAADFDHILATGVNNTIFWTHVSRSKADDFEELNLETAGFVLPPIKVSEDDPTSNAPVKTRAKLSSRHPQFFAFSRARAIYFVSQNLAWKNGFVDAKTRQIDSDKYLESCHIKISTTKGCKDFAFSEDDSIIATVEKTGRLKFWDIRPLSEAAMAFRPSFAVQDKPLLDMLATIGADKPAPTSVMFLDRERPYTKGGALRYVLVGFKQNHSFQLWDLAIGKTVQEIHLPHENDLDPICSIAYSPKTGILAVGHPTRNSIFYFHLSTPRYNIPVLDQARYLIMLASNDTSLPKPESTAIMSGVREITFASKGALRSIDMNRLPTHTGPDVSEPEMPLFELYVMHSKGITCLAVSKQDLGLGGDGKPIAPVDGEQDGYLSVGPLGTAVDATKPNTVPPSGGKAEPSQRQSSTVVRRAEDQHKAPSEDVKTPQDVETHTASKAPPSAPQALPKRAEVSQQPPAEINNNKSSTILGAEPSFGVMQTSRQQPQAEESNNLPIILGAEPSSGAIQSSFQQLYTKIDQDRKVQDAAANERQSAILKLVSSTLTDNVERSLDKIVSESIQTKVLPALTSQASAVIDRRLTEQLEVKLPQHVGTSVGHAVSAALSDKKTISNMTQGMTSHIRHVLDDAVAKSLIPQLSKLSVVHAQRAVAESEARFVERFEAMEEERLVDKAKLAQMHKLVTRLTGTIEQMAASQIAYQAQIAKQQERPTSGLGGHANGVVGPIVVVEETIVDEELEQIRRLAETGAMDTALLEVRFPTLIHWSVY